MITVNDMMNWLDNHDVNYTKDGVQEIYDEWFESKQALIEKLRKHPNWDEDAMAIILKEESYDRGFNKQAIKRFYNWVTSQISAELSKINKNKYIYDLNKELAVITNMISNYQNYLKDYFKILKINPLIDGDPMIYTVKDRKIVVESILSNYDEIFGYDVEKDIATKYRKVTDALSVFFDAENFLATKEQANAVNNILDLKAVEGQKISKIIRKICCTIGLDKVTDVQDMGTYTKDMGFNREYAILTDDINPFTFKKITVISVNPLDYWSMSHGKKWKSCHYVGDGEDGCYSSGTESYMLDGVSVIYYIIDENYEGKEYYSQPKERRCVFCIEPDGDMILESRVYPDGRDGGDQTLAGQFRNVMQKVVADCWDKNNYWNLKKGKENCAELTASCGSHYTDYTYYDDCNVSVNKDLTENKKIIIGHRPICPVCGGYHDDTENIICHSCRNEHTCERCGDGVDEYDGIYCEDNGCWYCCHECADEDGVHYCDDDGEYHDEDNCFYDDYLDYYHSGEPEVETEDGNKYASYDNAFNDGYEDDYYTGSWYSRDDMYWCEDESVYAHPNNGDYVYIEDDDKYFTSEDQAEYYGYKKDIDGDWHKEDDLTYCEDEDVYVLNDNVIVTTDGKFFSSEDKASEYGYHEVDGEWIKEVA